MNYKISLLLIISIITSSFSQKATIKEELHSMKTYMFSEPNDVANMSRIYPYFRFENYESEGKIKDWKMVVLENDYIKVFVCPAIGGKIWGAVEKSTGKEFIYYNNVVKFRDVAMRGAWTSGGLEYNFGDIGHIPTCATPVDYKLLKNKDGSVSCVVTAIDLPSRTKWNVEIKLEKDKAFFETKVKWFNNTSFPVTYYHWMNAAAKANGNLEFIYPGNKRIGHGGELGEWPNDDGRNISMYEKNNFGIYKSYHVINSYTDFFGGYWHDDNFGFGHYSSYDDMPGKKIWIWGLSEQGMIWEDLLTDSDGQYIEYQSGKLFNQAAHSSTKTPFKHKEFSPYDTDVMSELWFPLKETKGMVAASSYAAINVQKTEEKIQFYLNPLQFLNTKLVVKQSGKKIHEQNIKGNPLQLITGSFTVDKTKDFTIELGDKLLFYNSSKESSYVKRPLKSPENFNWNSAYGFYLNGLELEKQRRYFDAVAMYLKSYKINSDFIPTLNRLALSYYKEKDFDKALAFSEKALAIDTYDGLANYLFGIINKKLDNINEAKSGFSIASQAVGLRSASYTELAQLFLKEQAFKKAIFYADKALDFNTYNSTAIEVGIFASRKIKNTKKALEFLKKLEEVDPVSDFKNFENYLQESISITSFKNQITNEFPFENYLELASKYMKFGSDRDALNVLKEAPEHPIVYLWKASLDAKNETKFLKKALSFPIDLVFPYRNETLDIITQFLKKKKHWKLNYYKALLEWKSGRIDATKKMFNYCGEEPTTVAFYLSKIKLFNEDLQIVESALQRANKIDANNWKLQLAWMQFYKKNNQLELAKGIGKEAVKKHPKKAQIGMLYANILMKLKKYESCLEFLESMQVLPFEGATEGRNLYHEVCIRLSMEKLKQKEYNTAIVYAKKAVLWPKNLGVGKHYDVDERLDNYLLAFAYEKLENTKSAKNTYSKIVAHSTPKYLNESSKLILQLIAGRKLNQLDSVERLKKKYLPKTIENKYVHWAIEKFNGGNSNKIKNSILNADTKVQVYDTKYVDVEFNLLLEVVNEFFN